MALALLKYQFFLKNQYWVASGILFGIAAAIWVGPETKAGFIVIIVIFVLASVVARGLAQGVISILQAKDQAEGGTGEEEEGAEETPSDKAAKVATDKMADSEKTKA